MGDTTTSGSASALLPKSEWKVRRRVLIAAVAFCGLALGYVLYHGSSDALFQNALFLFTGAGVTLVGQYVFAATWDDNNWLKAMSTRTLPEQ